MEIEEEKYQEVFDEGARFNASMAIAGLAGAFFIGICGWLAWCCGAWICGLIRGWL